jgi:predicted signal transduction protein with EAL and GGDEF domain
MDKVSELHEKSRKLDEISKKISKPTAVSLKVLLTIITDLDQSKVMKDLFGHDILAHMGIVAVSNDLRIIDFDNKELSEDEKKIFLDELNRIIDSHAERI